MNFFPYRLLVTYVLSLLFLVSFYANANQTDSLIQDLTKLKGKEKVDALNQVCWELKYSNLDKAFSYGAESAVLAKKEDYEEGLSEALFNLAVVNSIKGDFNASSEYANKAIRIYSKVENLVDVAKCWNVIGLNEKSLGNYSEAIKYFKKAFNVFDLAGDINYLLKVEGNIAIVHYFLGNQDSALISYEKIIEYSKMNNNADLENANKFNAAIIYSELGHYTKAFQLLFEALEYWEQIEDKREIANAYNTIASTYNGLEMYDEAISAVKHSIGINRLLKIDRDIAFNFNTLANAYKNIGLRDSAFHYYHQALNIYQKLGIKTSGTIYNNLGTIYLNEGNTSEAKSYFQKAMELDSSIDKSGEIALYQYNLGRCKLVEGDSTRATSYFLKSFDYWKGVGAFKRLTSVSAYLYQIYAKQGDLNSAMFYQNENQIANDSAYGMKKRNEITRILLRRQLKEKEVSMSIQEVGPENKESAHVLILIIIVLSILIAASLFYKKRLISNLHTTLHQRNRELVFSSLTTLQKDEFINRFSNQLKTFVDNNDSHSQLRSLIQELKLQFVESNQWNHFKTTFEQIAPSFIDHLTNNYPKLTDYELRLCAMIRLNIPTQEISKILGISPSSLKQARYRLRKRLKLEGRRSLENFISSI